MKKAYDDGHGQALLAIARRTIEESLGATGAGAAAEPAALDDEMMRENHGVFVTLTKKGQLRGCIGYLDAREPVTEAVRHNAVNAAFHDPRFSPVKASELKDIDIEVSILSDPEALSYTDAGDLLVKLRPGIDGVIIRSGYHSATFLPQVWDQLPDKREFLAHLCLKAGLPSNEWEKGRLEVLTYQVQYFEEH
jgi:AmmeMemoRadiSam system protein A